MSEDGDVRRCATLLSVTSYRSFLEELLFKFNLRQCIVILSFIALQLAWLELLLHLMIEDKRLFYRCLHSLELILLEWFKRDADFSIFSNDRRSIDPPKYLSFTQTCTALATCFIRFSMVLALKVCLDRLLTQSGRLHSEHTLAALTLQFVDRWGSLLGRWLTELYVEHQFKFKEYFVLSNQVLRWRNLEPANTTDECVAALMELLEVYNSFQSCKIESTATTCEQLAFGRWAFRTATHLIVNRDVVLY